MNQKRFVWAMITLAIALASGELLARFYLGLGDPPLSITDANIEYLFKPNQAVNRFGNQVVINQYGMRSEPFAPQAAADELRIMVFGDSVLNGGSQTDQADLATSLVLENLKTAYAGDVVVGNISAGSWGPGNWLAYAQTYGFFDADVVILVISSHDYADNPTFEPLDPDTHPTKKPVSALLEGFERYLPRYLPGFTAGPDTAASDDSLDPAPEDVRQGLQDLKDFLTLAQSQSESVLVFQHWDEEEMKAGKAKPGNSAIQEICQSLGITPIQLAPYYLKAMEAGDTPYRDNIHLNELGQRLLEEAMKDHLSALVTPPSS